MKRRHEDLSDDEEAEQDEGPAASVPRQPPQPDETIILQDLKSNLLKDDLNKHIEQRLFESQKEYFTVYMEKLMHKIPMGENLVKIIQKDGESNFEYMFTAAKSLIQSQMRVKQIKAFHAVFDMVYSLVWRYIHEKVVTPTLAHVVTDKQLRLAYEKYQSFSQADEDGPVLEMQCLLHNIQETLANAETVKIPNPLYTRLTQQMKAMSEYVITLLICMSKPAVPEEVVEAKVKEILVVKEEEDPKNDFDLLAEEEQ